MRSGRPLNKDVAILKCRVGCMNSYDVCFYTDWPGMDLGFEEQTYTLTARHNRMLPKPKTVDPTPKTLDPEP